MLDSVRLGSVPNGGLVPGSEPAASPALLYPPAAVWGSSCLADAAASRRECKMGKWCRGKGFGFSVHTNCFYSFKSSGRCIECAGIKQPQF